MPPVTLPVVVWSHGEKVLKSCSVSTDTTFQDVIASLGLNNIKSALVGHGDMPFKLMAGDFAPADDYNPEDMPTCLANTFTGKVVDIVFWMAYVGEGPIAEGKLVLGRKQELDKMLPDVLAGHAIHLFTYDHRRDCCQGIHGPFTERDPADTTAASSIWLRLEQEYIQGGRQSPFHGWTQQVPDVPSATVAVNMERLNADGTLTVTGWGMINPTDKVSALFDRTNFFREWRSYRVAYGHQKGRDTPTFVRWTQPMTAQYDPTIQELFTDITLLANESYFLLISRLDVSNPPPAAHKFLVDHAVSRFPQLFGAPPGSDVPERQSKRPKREYMAEPLELCLEAIFGQTLENNYAYVSYIGSLVTLGITSWYSFAQTTDDMPLFADTPEIRRYLQQLRVACKDLAFRRTVHATFEDDTADPFDSRDIILTALGNFHSQLGTTTMSEFRPENLHEAWKLLAQYIEKKGIYTKNLQREYPEAFETWGLITRLYDAYRTNGVESDIQKQIAEILSRARMPTIFDGVYNDDSEKIYMVDLLGYINGALHTNVPHAALSQHADMQAVLQSMHALLREL